MSVEEIVLALEVLTDTVSTTDDVPVDEIADAVDVVKIPSS